MNSSNEKKKGAFEKYFPMALSAAIILTGIFYIIAVCHLFFTGGDTPYTRDRVGEYLLILAIPSFITIIMVIVGSVLRRVAGKDKFTGKYQGTATADFRMKARLENLSAGFNYEKAPKAIRSRIARQHALKRDSFILAVTVSALALIPTLAVLIDIERYTIENLNENIAFSALVVLGNVFAALVVWSTHAIACSSATEQEIFAIKDAVREDPSLFKAPEKKDVTSPLDSLKTAVGIRVFVALLAVILIALGVSNGGMADVLAKAVKICTECIGLG